MVLNHYLSLYTNSMSIYCIWPSVDRAAITSVRDIWFLQSVCELYIEEDVLYIHPANEWMWTPQYLNTTVLLRGLSSNGLVGLVYTVRYSLYRQLQYTNCFIHPNGLNVMFQLKFKHLHLWSDDSSTETKWNRELNFDK